MEVKWPIDMAWRTVFFQVCLLTSEYFYNAHILQSRTIVILSFYLVRITREKDSNTFLNRCLLQPQNNKIQNNMLFK